MLSPLNVKYVAGMVTCGVWGRVTVGCVCDEESHGGDAGPGSDTVIAHLPVPIATPTYVYPEPMQSAPSI